jgi:hypothetical protein
MRRTVNYRSTLIMAATLGGTALAQTAPARAHPEHYGTGAEERLYRRSVAAPQQRLPGGPSVTAEHEPPVE